MRFTSTLKKITVPLMALGTVLMLFSCGAYQYVGYDNDGIYSSDQVVVDVEEAATNRTNSNYYANYFAEHVNEAQSLQDEVEVFTDIDSYSSGTVANQEEIIEDYGGWGQVNDQVTINYYNNGWNNWGWGFNDPWLWNGGFGWNNWGWNNWGWNRWNRWGGFGFGFGWGWNNPWVWNANYGFGFGHWGWNNAYRGNYYAYNNSRRGSAYNRSHVNNSRRNGTGVSRRLASTNRRGTTVGRRNTTTRPGRTVRNPRIRGGNSTSTRPSRGTITRPRGSVTRPSRGTTTRPSRGTTTRPSRGSVSRPSRSGSVRSSRGSSSRSSGSVRSSRRSSSRSSGGSRSGGSRGGRRG